MRFTVSDGDDQHYYPLIVLFLIAVALELLAVYYLFFDFICSRCLIAMEIYMERMVNESEKIVRQQEKCFRCL